MHAHACRRINLRFGEQSLRPDHIAADPGISTRMMHRIFAENGETVMRHLFAERVKRAADQLASPAARHRTVTEIAYACGFSGSSHFARVFTEHFGMTPTQWRNQANP